MWLFLKTIWLTSTPFLTPMAKKCATPPSTTKFYRNAPWIAVPPKTLRTTANVSSLATLTSLTVQSSTHRWNYLLALNWWFRTLIIRRIAAASFGSMAYLYKNTYSIHPWITKRYLERGHQFHPNFVYFSPMAIINFSWLEGRGFLNFLCYTFAIESTSETKPLLNCWVHSFLTQ